MRRLVFAIYALVFLAEVVNWAIVPLAPRFRDDFDLSKVETGAILAAASVMTILVSVPVGVWADRLGPRLLTLASAALIAAGTVGQGFAGDFWSLLGARLVFGTGFAVVWTAGLAWLAQVVPPGRRTAALGATTTTAGIGGLIGPAAAGLLAQRFGVETPFLATGLVAAVVCVLLLALPQAPLAEPHRRPAGETYRLAWRNLAVLGGLAVTVLGGLTAGVVNLLVPLQLDDNGVSEGLIGVVFSAGAAIFIVVSATVARLGDRASRVSVGGSAALALACVLGLVIASAATPVIVAFVLLRAPLMAVLFTIAFPLAARGARRAGVGEGAVLGLLNLLWGVSTVVGPLAGGAIAQAAGERFAYGAVAGCCLVTGTWALLAARTETVQHREAPAPAASPGHS